MSNAKLAWIEDHEWQQFLRGLEGVVQGLTGGVDGDSNCGKIPNEEENSSWYHERTLRELSGIWHFLQQVKPTVRQVGLAAFSAILRFACSQDKHWGWICDNVKPSTLHYRPAARMFLQKVLAFRQYSRELQHNSVAWPRGDQEIARLGTCADVLGGIAAESIDAVITSPPYYCMTDYIRSQRLTFLWFSWEFDRFRATESGARYKRHRLQSRAEYLADIEKSFMEIGRVLRPGRRCGLVIGESPRREPVLDEFDAILGRSGLYVELKLARSVPKQRTMLPQLHHEEVLIARKC